MTDGWARSTVTNPNSFGFYGSYELTSLHPGQTLLRSWWNIGMFDTTSGTGSWPPGSSILRAGVVLAAPGLNPETTVPTPITNADADWLAITTVNASLLQLAVAVDVSWQTNWGFPIDLSIKSQRKNATAENQSLYVAWEFALSGADTGFGVNGWWASLDALIRTP
jgi:hypothetical protein